MVGRFGRGTQQTALRMAAGAGGIGWPESAANMAALTGNVRMRAIQHESRAEMIERLLRRSVG